MKKNLLVSLSLFAFMFVSCDERIDPLASKTVPPPTTTVSKTDLLARKWGFSENYIDVDGKKTVLYGTGATNNPNLSTDVSAEDYIIFTKDGKVESYSAADKKTSKSTWKFLNNETQIQFSLDGGDFLMDINVLTDKDADISQKVVIANLANESETAKGIVLIAGIGGLATQSSKVVKLGFKLKPK
jgi:hypothetical protein